MRNVFNLSHEHKTTVNMGQLIPVCVDEVLPGDTFIQRSTALARVAPLVNPLMHRVELRMHSFYVPNRIAWNELEREEVDLGNPVPFRFEEFITGADSSINPPIAAADGSPLWDYMGVPKTYLGDIDWTPVVAFNMIYNDYYRDQDLQTKRNLIDTTIPNCAWQKDYFTIARPQPQQGASTSVPLSGSAELKGLFNSTSTNPPDGNFFSWDSGQLGSVTDPRYVVRGDGSTPSAQLADGSINIDDLRQTIALQRFAEARMRYGERYVDYLRYLGINPSNGSLDRPEYLGGGKDILNFSEVLQTSEGPTSNVGDMYGHGIGMGRTNGFRKQFEEHGWCITLLSARPKTVYMNALPRKFTRKTFEDYWQQELEILPWQEVKQVEVDVSGDADTVFGYVPRYEEYRFGTSHVSNTMRQGTEEDWHMGRKFASPPILNGSFVECTPTDRIYADSNMPELILNIQHSIQARRLVGATASMGVDL